MPKVITTDAFHGIETVDAVCGAEQLDDAMPASSTTGLNKRDTYSPVLGASGTPLTSGTYCLEDSAFAVWRATMSSQLLVEPSNLKERVVDLQKEFEDASHYIRGDFAWRKQVATFNENVNAVIGKHMADLVDRLQQNTESLSRSIDETLKTKDHFAKQEIDRHVRTYEDKLRRTRTSLKKEIDRFTHLEKCLRMEETHQAKEMYNRLVHQLSLEHAAKEAALNALLRELKLSYSSIETANTQLMETVKSKGDEIERLKKLLPKTSDVPSASHGQPQRAASTNNRPSSGAAGGPSDVYVQGLKQALHTANQTIEGLRRQLDNDTSEKDATLKKQKIAEESAAGANDELVKVKQLLSESHEALLNNRKEIDSARLEMEHWKDLFTELQFRSGSHQHQQEDAQRYVDSAKVLIESYEHQLRKHRAFEAEHQRLVRLLEAWSNSEDVGKGVDVVRDFVHHIKERSITDTSTFAEADYDELRRQHVEAKLCYEHERRYGEQLNIRICHERKRILGRLSMLWAKHDEERENRTSRRLHAGATEHGRRAIKSEADMGKSHRSTALPQKTVLQLLSTAFDDLGFTSWADFDIDFQRDEVVRMKDIVAKQKTRIEALTQLAESQALALETAGLQQREKELLLNELTERYRLARTQLDVREQANASSEPAPDLARWEERERLTVYGLHQPLEPKKPRSRPVSAAAALAQCDESKPSFTTSSTREAAARIRPRSSAGPERWKRGSKSLLPMGPSVTGTRAVEHGTEGSRDLDEEHVRSILKGDFLCLTPTENQLDDGGHVGADGILQIIQRRRNRN